MIEFSPLSRTLLKHGISAITAFMLVIWLQLRPLSVFFLVILTVWLYQTQCKIRILLPPEFLRKFQNLQERFCNLRETQPKMLYAVAFVFLSALALVGHILSGLSVAVLSLLLAAFLTAKYDFKFVKMEPRDFVWPEKYSHDTDIDDEFLLEENESNLCVLDRASDLATLSSPLDDEAEDDKSDEVPSELLIPDVIPEIDETYTDEDEDVDDLVPILKKNALAAKKQINTSNEMEFKKGHFKRDSSLSTTSSSSDEESLSKGLKFPDHTMVDGACQRQILPPPASNSDATDFFALAVKSQSQALLQNSNKLIPSLLSGLGRVMAGAASGSTVAIPAQATIEQRVVTALDSSDESDFEILENDDFQ